MSNYNFAALDDKEFEALAVDLVGILNDVRVERFKPGKDRGVDGRWFASNEKEIIVQCKHWMRSGVKALIKHLSQSEKPKIDKLNPARYLLVTSVELSRQNKVAIRDALAPHIRSESDVLGSEDIHDLLARYPEIENSHYKLWLSSAAVISRIINNAVHGRSQFDARAIQSRLPLFVKTGDYDKVSSLLNRKRAVIITGVPGIGKTTLAEQLIVEHLADGYDLVSIRDINEGEAVYTIDTKQLFYFDDFLGRNLLEAIAQRSDSQIVGFIKRIRHDPLKRFVLTSRSNILNQGKHLTDLFGLNNLEQNEYEVHVRHMRRLDRARILYSHIWHSSLSDEMLGQLFAEKRYKTIADHRNFNPRLIAFITDSDKTSSVLADRYWDHVVATLENPQDLWSHFFSSQLSQDCRDLVYLVVLNGKSISDRHLREAFRQIRPRVSYDIGKLEHDMMVAIKVCVDSVLNRGIDSQTGSVSYDLYNPSIADYVFRAVADWSAYRSYFAALRTCASLRNLTYMNKAGVLSNTSYKIVLAHLADNSCDESDETYLTLLCEMLFGQADLVLEYESTLRKILNGLRIDKYSGDSRTLLRVLSAAMQLELLDCPDSVISKVCDQVDAWSLGADDFELLTEVVSQGSDDERGNYVEKARQSVLTYWKEYIAEYVYEAELLREVYSEEQYEDAKDELIDAVTDQLAATNLSFYRSEIWQVCDEVDLGNIIERNIKWDMRTDDEPGRPSGPTPTETEDQQIDDLFDRDGQR